MWRLVTNGLTTPCLLRNAHSSFSLVFLLVFLRFKSIFIALSNICLTPPPYPDKFVTPCNKVDYALLPSPRNNLNGPGILKSKIHMNIEMSLTFVA